MTYILVTLTCRKRPKQNIKYVVMVLAGYNDWCLIIPAGWALEAIHRGSLTLILTLTLIDPRWIASSIHNSGVLAGGAGGPWPPQWRFFRGRQNSKGRQNCSKALVKTFVTILEPMKEKWTEFYQDLRSVWQCLCLCVCPVVCHRHWQQPQHIAPVPLFLIPSSWQINWQADFGCARFFGNLGQRMIKLLTAANTAWCACALTLLATSSVCSQTAQRMWNCELLIC